MLMLEHLAGNIENEDLFEEDHTVSMLLSTLERGYADEEGCRCAINAVQILLRTPDAIRECELADGVIRVLVSRLGSTVAPKILTATYQALAALCSADDMRAVLGSLPGKEGMSALELITSGLHHKSLKVKIGAATAIAALGQSSALQPGLAAGDSLARLLDLLPYTDI